MCLPVHIAPTHTISLLDLIRVTAETLRIAVRLYADAAPRSADASAFLHTAATQPGTGRLVGTDDAIDGCERSVVLLGVGKGRGSASRAPRFCVLARAQPQGAARTCRARRPSSTCSTGRPAPCHL